MSDKEKNRRTSLNSIKNSDEDKGKNNSIKPEAVTEDEDVQGNKILDFKSLLDIQCTTILFKWKWTTLKTERVFLIITAFYYLSEKNIKERLVHPFKKDFSLFHWNK